MALQWYESERNILRKTTNTGREVAFRLLKEGQRLKHDDVVFISDELAIVIEILPSEVIVLRRKLYLKWLELVMKLAINIRHCF